MWVTSKRQKHVYRRAPIINSYKSFVIQAHTYGASVLGDLTIRGVVCVWVPRLYHMWTKKNTRKGWRSFTIIYSFYDIGINLPTFKTVFSNYFAWKFSYKWKMFFEICAFIWKEELRTSVISSERLEMFQMFLKWYHPENVL